MRRLLFVLAIAAALSAQIPSRQFKDGEVLKVEGADVTIRNPQAGPCIETEQAKKMINSGLACVTSSLGFFQVRLTAKDVDYIEITVGRETHVNGIANVILRFEVFTSPVHPDLDMAVGSIDRLDIIRTIRVRLLKTKEEKMFR